MRVNWRKRIIGLQTRMPLKASQLIQLWPCFGAFLLYGSWAAWVHAAQQANWLQHALLQACYAFASTLAVQTLALAFYRALARSAIFAAHTQVMAQAMVKAMAWACTSFFAAALPAFLQWLIGSQAVLLSIAPGAVASSVFIALVLWRSKPDVQKQSRDSELSAR